MLFNSLQFLVFFLVVTLWFFLLKTQRSRIWLLLIASCYFYLSFVPQYLLILGGTIVIDFFAGIFIARSEGRGRKAWLVLSLIANIGILAYFKYCNFFLDNLNDALHLLGSEKQYPLFSIVLPIGLSFHTFQAMSYTIEVYRGRQQAERNFPMYALYVMFYPQLVAGPIERPQNILPQLKEYRPYNWEVVKDGLARMLWGFFKKVVVADRLAMAADYIFGHYTKSSSAVLALGAVFYAFQIYCDFSGYCDIGIGAARGMNIQLMENFNQPYLSRSITEFWTRWHISLSSWFRDYLYIPLGGNRKGELRRRLNVFIVFLLSGLWHGANWTFVLWGGLHGTAVTVSGATAKLRYFKKLPAFIAILFTFSLVAVFWVFFRAPNWWVAVRYLKGLFSFHSGSHAIGMNGMEAWFSVALIAVVLCREYVRPYFHFRREVGFWMYVVLSVLCCYFFGVFGENQFIYFQF